MCVYVCTDKRTICSLQGPLSNQSVNRGGAQLISHPSSLPSLVPKTDALGNKANQYTPSQSSLPTQRQEHYQLFVIGTATCSYQASQPLSSACHVCKKHKRVRLGG